MAYLTDTSLENYNQLKETLSLLIKNFDWKAQHGANPKSLQSRITVIRKIESQLNEFERLSKIPRTKPSELSLSAIKKRLNSQFLQL